MKIISLEIEGFRSYGSKQIIQFQDGTLYLLTGDNRDRGISSASGKSSIFKALTTVLFEENDDDSTHDAAINTVQPEKGCRIATTFLDDAGVYYYVVYARQHPEEGTHWTLYRWDGTQWQPEKGARNSDTKKIIHEHINLTYEQFVNQAYIPQSRVAEFIERTDKERKAIFGNILNLGECDKYLHAASEWRKELRQNLLRGQGALSTLEAQIRNLSNNLVEKTKLEEWTADLQKKEERLVYVAGEQRSLEDEAEKLKAIYDLKSRKRYLAEHRASLLSKLQQAYTEMMEEPVFLDDPVEQVNDLQQRYAIAESVLQAAIKNLHRTQTLGAQCGECEQDIPESLRQSLHQKYKIEVEQLIFKRDTLKDSLDKALYAKQYYAEKSKVAQSYQANVSALSNQAWVVSGQLDETNAQIKELEDVIGEGVDIPDSIEEARKNFTKEQIQLSREITELQAFIRNANLANASYTDLLGQASKQKVSNEELEKSIAYIERCESLIGDKGFKSFKINTSRDAFNESLAKYLSILTDGEVQAELVTQVPKADGKALKTELDIIVKDGDKRHVPIRQYSGGEKSSLSLAIVGAFGDLSAAQSDAGVNLLLLDEPFANLDTWGEQQMCTLLENLTADGRIVLAITNHPSVKDKGKFDREIRAIKENHITHIEEYDLSEEH